ncbi:MAG: amidohydrolase family protein [Desulfobacteraceae bacterium]
MLIDAHSHAYRTDDRPLIKTRSEDLDRCVPASDPGKWVLHHEGSAHSLVREEQRAGIDRCVLLPVSGRAERVSELNRWSAEKAEEDPMIIPFATLMAASAGLEEDLEEILDLGLQGVKIHPVLQHLDILSDEAHAMWSLLEEAGLPVVLDTMSIQDLPRFKPHLRGFSAFAGSWEAGPSRVGEMAEAHPGLTVIAAHLGSLFGWDHLEPLYDLDNVYFDLSFVSGIIPDEAVMEIIGRKGSDRVFFGTDTPWRDPLQERRWFESLPLGAEEREAVSWKNLAGLLGL